MIKQTSLFLALLILLTACNTNNTPSELETEETSTEPVAFHYPEWSKDAVIYEVNTRQFSEEGTFNAFAEHLPRLSEMGIDILWLMPIHPIGLEKRKATPEKSLSDIPESEWDNYQGSPYSVQNYKAINPDYGTAEDFQNLVDKAHELGMKLILDWVPNHSAWDNVWMQQGHTDFYTTDSLGNIIHPEGTDWTDVADLNYDNKELRDSMLSALKFWITEFNIDGYRCDVAEMVPMDFWNKANQELRQLKPEIFMLAEADKVELSENGFHMTYGWENHHILNEIAKGEMNAQDLADYLKRNSETYGDAAYRMYFTSNHDENTWNGTVWERMGDASKTLAALTFIMPSSMPLIYNGQEDSLAKRLAFFEKDPINWSGNYVFEDFYKDLIKLKKDNPALWNGEFGGDYTLNVNETVIYITRNKDDNRVAGVFNLSDQAVTYSLNDEPIELAPWGYHLEMTEGGE